MKDKVFSSDHLLRQSDAKVGFTMVTELMFERGLSHSETMELPQKSAPSDSLPQNRAKSAETKQIFCKSLVVQSFLEQENRKLALLEHV